MKLDLACGPVCQPGFEGVDIVDLPGVKHVLNLVAPSSWPFADDSVDELYCSHFIEHIPADNIPQDGREKDRLFHFFDETYRIIKPGGVFTLKWPALKSSDAFRDPTHRRFLPLEFLHYLSREGREVMGVSHYNVDCNWRTVETLLQVEHEPTEKEICHLWDIQKGYEVKLVAVKP